MHRYPAVYSDARGDEEIVLASDGRSLAMVVRGVSVEGTSLDDFEPTGVPTPAQHGRLRWRHGALFDFTLSWSMPLPVLVHDQVEPARLEAVFWIGPSASGAAQRTTLVLSHRGARVEGAGDFEAGLLAIQRQLPEGTRLRACIGCRWSDYSPAGSPDFGGMLCFRGAQALYRQVTGKHGLLDILDQHTALVQETHCCEDFAPRPPGTGYRG